MIEFSVVIPVYKELKLIPITFPSYLTIGASEVVICMDEENYPQKQEILRLLENVYWSVVDTVEKRYKIARIPFLRVIEINKNPEWGYHQAWVRRVGFTEARHDVILTGDIDLIVNNNVLNAINLVGKNNIGLASLQKFRKPRSLIGFLRAIFRECLRRVGISRFTGLYAFYRPWWKETEGELAKHMVSVKRIGQFHSSYGENLGEDTHLKNFMEKKYKTVLLNFIGAVDLQEAFVDIPRIQYVSGMYAKSKRRSIIYALIHTMANFHPHYLMGYRHQKRLELLDSACPRSRP